MTRPPPVDPGDAAHWAVEEALVRERVRISRELHDQIASDLAGALALLKLHIDREGDDPDEGLLTVREALESVLASTRETIRSLRPSHRLGEAGLVEEVRRTASEVGRIYGIRVEVWTGGTEEGLTAGQREAVFQVVREALTNVRKHSASSICRVRLALAARPFLIEVTDEGKGFHADPTAGYGILGMRERAAGIGGRLEVVSTPGRGTTVFLFGPDPAAA